MFMLNSDNLDSGILDENTPQIWTHLGGGGHDIKGGGGNWELNKSN